MAIPKLNKLLAQGLSESGITEFNELEEKLIPRILGGSSLYIVCKSATDETETAPEEKPSFAAISKDVTRATMIAILQRLNYSQPDAPRAIIMAPTNEEADLLVTQFKKLAKNMDLKIHLAHEGGLLDNQNKAIYAGADLVVATPKRLIKLYFECALNVNRVQTFVLYNATRLIDARFHVEIDRFTDSLPKFQALVLTDEVNDKLKKACGKFMQTAQVFEIG